jgi:hypothetical protein
MAMWQGSMERLNLERAVGIQHPAAAPFGGGSISDGGGALALGFFHHNSSMLVAAVEPIVYASMNTDRLT